MIYVHAYNLCEDSFGGTAPQHPTRAWHRPAARRRTPTPKLQRVADTHLRPHTQHTARIM